MKGHITMKTTNCYPEFDEFENILINILAASLTRRYHLNREDREDVRQELAICIFEKKSLYDPETNPERYEEYIRECLRRQSLQISKKIRPDIYLEDEESNSAIAAIIENSRGRTTESHAVVNVLSEIIYNQLSPTQQELVNQLTAGLSITEITRQSGVPYKTVHTRVEKIRQIFRNSGLHAPRFETR
jgi:DNA-directed RNA polymerase specialized sigma24 family protein